MAEAWEFDDGAEVSAAAGKTLRIASSLTLKRTWHRPGSDGFEAQKGGGACTLVLVAVRFESGSLLLLMVAVAPAALAPPRDRST